MSWVAVAVGGAGLISGVAGGMMGGSEPSGRRLIRESAQGGVQALQRSLPNQLMYNQLYDPLFASLGSKNLESLLFGSAGGAMDVPTYNSRGVLQGTRSVNQPSSRGLLDIIGQAAPEFRRISGESRRADMESNLGNIEANLPRAQALYQEQNPELFALRQRLTETANQNLAMGGKIGPEDSYRITSGVRGDWAQRGLGATAPAQLDEAVQLFAGGENLRQSRTAQSSDILSRLAESEPDYAKFLLGLGDDTALANAFNLVSGNQQGAFSQDFDPINPASTSLGGLGANLQFQQSSQNQDMWAGLGGGLLDLSGTLAKRR